jgi:hypothetical protein
MEQDVGLLASRAEKSLRCEGISDLPRKLGNAEFFIARISDETVSEVIKFSFVGKEYKVGEMVNKKSFA